MNAGFRLHKKSPFDFGISLGDAINNNQYNEARWYIDVMDGKIISPSSGSHRGADSIDYQKPYQSAGLDKSIPWYQAIGNHDHFFMGAGANVSVFANRTLAGTFLTWATLSRIRTAVTVAVSTWARLTAPHRMARSSASARLQVLLHRRTLFG